MTRRPLGASLPIDERADALERRIRDFYATVDRMAAALERFETAPSRRTGERAWSALRAELVALQELRESTIGSRRRTETVAAAANPHTTPSRTPLP